MIVNIFNNQNALIVNHESVKQIVIQVLKRQKCKCDEVNIHFVDIATICDLHNQFFCDPSPTDCISFPMDEQEDSFYRILGEIFVCPQTAIQYAQDHQTDPYLETTLYIVHGLLHLLGFDDIEDADRKIMREAEKEHLNNLKAKNLTIRPLNI